MTRAMELGGSALMQMGNTADAKVLLIRGYEQAASKGEMRVKDGIASILTESGIELPTVEQASPGETGKSLDKQPLPGKIGKWILENVDADLWQVWIGQGTKVINELRLDFSREEDQKSYEDYMVEFLGIPSNVIEEDKKATSK